MAVVSIPVVITALVFIWFRKARALSCLLWSVALLFFAIPLFSTLMFFTGLLLLIMGLVAAAVPDHHARGIIVGIALVPMAYGTVRGTMNTIEQQTARRSFPITSLRPRLVKKNDAPVRLATVGKYEQLESRMDLHPSWFGSRRRALRAVHQSAVAHFLMTPEFGVTRMGYPDLSRLTNSDGSPIEMPLDPSLSAIRTTSLGSTAIDSNADDSAMDLADGHAVMQSWFLDPERLGHVEDLDHVTGFQSHAFRSPDDHAYRLQGLAVDAPFPTFNANDRMTYRYRLEKLQLIGLLYHSEPVVYDLTTMPDLVHADSAKTRPLDDFENEALSVLQSGEPIASKRFDHEVRMLGGIRNAESCVECHQESTDTLLGAFTYSLSIQGDR